MTSKSWDWSEEDEDILRKEFLTTPLTELARRLGRTEAAIKERACVLGVTDKSRVSASVYRRIIERSNGKRGLYVE